MIDLDRIELVEAKEEYRFLDICKLCAIKDEDNTYMILDKYTREVYGIIEYEVSKGGDSIHIDLIDVWEDNRRQGIARRVVEILNRDYSITGDSVLNAIEFWNKVGAEFEDDIKDEEVLRYYMEQCICAPFIIH